MKNAPFLHIYLDVVPEADLLLLGKTVARLMFTTWWERVASKYVKYAPECVDELTTKHVSRITCRKSSDVWQYSHSQLTVP